MTHNGRGIYIVSLHHLQFLYLVQQFQFICIQCQNCSLIYDGKLYSPGCSTYIIIVPFMFLNSINFLISVIQYCLGSFHLLQQHATSVGTQIFRPLWTPPPFLWFGDIVSYMFNTLDIFFYDSHYFPKYPNLLSTPFFLEKTAYFKIHPFCCKVKCVWGDL